MLVHGPYVRMAYKGHWWQGTFPISPSANNLTTTTMSSSTAATTPILPISPFSCVLFCIGGYTAYADTSQDTVLTHCNQGLDDDRDVVPMINGVEYPSLAEVSLPLPHTPHYQPSPTDCPPPGSGDEARSTARRVLGWVTSQWCHSPPVLCLGKQAGEDWSPRVDEGDVPLWEWAGGQDGDWGVDVPVCSFGGIGDVEGGEEGEEVDQPSYGQVGWVWGVEGVSWMCSGGSPDVLEGPRVENWVWQVAIDYLSVVCVPGCKCKVTRKHWGLTPIYPAGTLRVFWEFLSNSPTLYTGGNFWMHLKKSPAIYLPGAFKIYPSFWSQLTHWANWEQIQNEPIRFILFWLVGTLRTFSKKALELLS